MNTSLFIIWFGPIIFALCAPFILTYIHLMFNKTKYEKIRIRDIFHSLVNQDDFDMDLYAFFLMFSFVPILGIIVDILVICIVLHAICEDNKQYKQFQTIVRYIVYICILPIKFIWKTVVTTIKYIFNAIGNIRIG